MQAPTRSSGRPPPESVGLCDPRTFQRPDERRMAELASSVGSHRERVDGVQVPVGRFSFRRPRCLRQLAAVPSAERRAADYDRRTDRPVDQSTSQRAGANDSLRQWDETRTMKMPERRRKGNGEREERGGQ